MFTEAAHIGFENIILMNRVIAMYYSGYRAYSIGCYFSLSYY